MRSGFPGGTGTTHPSLIRNSALSMEAAAHSVAVAHQVHAAVLIAIAARRLVHFSGEMPFTVPARQKSIDDRTQEVVTDVTMG